MGRKDLLDLFNIRENLIIILKIAVPSSVKLDILNYLIKTPSSTNTFISLIVLYFMLIHIVKKNSYINYPNLYKKSLIYFVLSIFISVAIESFTYPLILKLVDKTYQDIIKDIYLVILCSLSSRIIDILILGYIFADKNSKYQFNINEYF
jgi:uncharacterized membrane protein